ncbi:MAG TPA: type II toxin-antitoxin system VapC family toxin [Thermoanaerobaculia bacterium]|nr:type II toxin-antitoxin system VapC family toxin [Thermoanaerobaculia bacterium]
MSHEMTLPMAYVETTIPSFYFTERRGAESVVRREWTRRWWSVAPSSVVLVTSAAVAFEIGRAPTALASQAAELLEPLPRLDEPDAVAEIVAAYIRHLVMPRSATGDALHLAIASFHGCRFLVTWNCKHLANANKFDHITRVNTMLGLSTPHLVTPLELLGE